MIKIASMVGAPDLQTPTLAPYTGNLNDAFFKLATLGYDGVELMLRDPARMDGQLLRQLLNNYNLKFVAICTGHVYGEDQLGLVGPDLQTNPVAMQRAKEFVDFIDLYFDPGTMINIGRIRGPADPACPEESWQAYVHAFREFADYAAPRGVRLILEPVSKDEVKYFHSTQEGLKIAHMVDRPNFGLMLDTYHMQREDKDILSSLYEAGSLCWHMHFSENNRCYPGSGDIRFDQIVDALNQIGYNGYVGMEIKAWPDPDTAAKNSIEYLRQWIPGEMNASNDK